MTCNDAVEALIAFVRSGEPISEEQREHLRTCARCRELLDSTRQFQSMLEEAPVKEPEVDATVIEDAVRHEHRKSILRKVVAIIGVSAILIAIVASMRSYGAFGMPELILLLAIFALPVVVGIALARAIESRSRTRLYKRLKPGRQISGVCLGIAEATRVSVTVVRLVFVALLFFKGAGAFLYLALDLAMPVHPADREYLWRFKAKKLLAWIRSHG